MFVVNMEAKVEERFLMIHLLMFAKLRRKTLLNRLLEEGRLSEVGIIVIDEVHMVGDQQRGYLLELMLTKLRYGAGEGRLEFSKGECSGSNSGKSDPTHGLQIVGMSATSPNVNAVANWLQAALYQTNLRPVVAAGYTSEELYTETSGLVVPLLMKAI
ncbi:unnamed protein product [Lactuca saligna]|uniref:Helicase ATP-binding domain-containing protein n=1 Tax=Lactuca saligna TaxID=75948 RepID=A0AA36A278_LACSI|nr:unnamed protein product [Lactuca saligna]